MSYLFRALFFRPIRDLFRDLFSNQGKENFFFIFDRLNRKPLVTKLTKWWTQIPTKSGTKWWRLIITLLLPILLPNFTKKKKRKFCAQLFRCNSFVLQSNIYLISSILFRPFPIFFLCSSKLTEIKKYLKSLWFKKKLKNGLRRSAGNE